MAIVAWFLLAPPAGGSSQFSSALLAAMNDVRAAHGLRPLRADVRLERAATAHSADMIHRRYFAHGRVAARLTRYGARGRRFGENLAWAVGGAADARTIVRLWLASRGHRANVLRPGFRRVGVGAVTGPFAGHGSALVVTADFAGR